MRTKNRSPRGSHKKPRRDGGLLFNPSATNNAVHKPNAKLKRLSVKRKSLLSRIDVANTSTDSPRGNGLYRRRPRNNRPTRRNKSFYRNAASHNNINGDDDVIVVQDQPVEIISLLDDDDETSDSKPLRKNHLEGSTSSHNSLPFFVDKKNEEAPVIPIPLYEPIKDTSVICLDDTVPSSNSAVSPSKFVKKYTSILSENNKTDESLISIDNTLEDGEIIDWQEDFIPINNVPEKESPAKKKRTKTEKRLIIIDGNNVALHHGNNKQFSAEGIKIVIDYFEKLGHEVKVIVPQFRMKLTKTTSQVLMQELQKKGNILLTPCKNLPGKFSSSYDDRFILEVAEQCDAAIISNDNYKDLMKEKKEWSDIINSRVVGFMFCNDVFMVPKDPYGKWGPKLDTILYKKPKPES